MRLRLTKIDELQFLTTVKHCLWGSRKSRFTDWQKGDYLGFMVNKTIAGLAAVAGDPFVSKEPVWDNGVFPNRIPLKFLQVMLPENRLPVLGDIRDVLIGVWGNTYGWGILNQVALDEALSKKIVAIIKNAKNDLPVIHAKFEHYLNDAFIQREHDAACKSKH